MNDLVPEDEAIPISRPIIYLHSSSVAADTGGAAWRAAAMQVLLLCQPCAQQLKGGSPHGALFLAQAQQLHPLQKRHEENHGGMLRTRIQ